MINIFKDIEEERQFQDKKFGIQNHNIYKWLAILSEEVGEASEAALNIDFNNHVSAQEKQLLIKKLRDELIDVAAVAVAIIEQMDDGKLKI